MKKRLSICATGFLLAALLSFQTAQAQADADDLNLDELSSITAVDETAPPPPKVERPWYDRIQLRGDFRYRFEHIDDDSKTSGKTRNRHRFRFRLRGLAEVNELVDIGFALASGSDDPVSTNESFDDGWATNDLGIDLAYFDFHPYEGDTALNFVGGKINVPFAVMSKTELMWDSDVRPEGLAANFARKMEENINIFAHAAYFIAEERSDAADTTMWGGQVGSMFGLDEDNSLTFGGGFYDWVKVKDQVTLYDETDGFGNDTYTLAAEEYYADDYDIYELFAEYATKLAKKPLHVFGTFAQNTRADDEDTAWLAGAKFGKVKEFGTWDVRYQYKYLEKNSVIGVFTDSDFGGGGTNSKGHEFNVGFGLDKNWKVAVSYFLNERFIASGENEEDYKRLQIDLKFKF